MRLLMIALLGAASIWTARAGDAQAAFNNKDYAGAVKDLESQIATSRPNAESYYDLGVAYEKQGATAQAMLNYERALLLDPGLKDARNALALLASAKNIPLPPHSWKDDVTAVAHPETQLALGSTLVWAGLFGLVFASQLPRRRGLLNALSIFALLVGGALSASGWLTDARLSSARPAIVTAKDGTDVLTEPATNSPQIVSLPAGSPVGVVSPRGAWTYVDLAGGARGWVQTANLSPIAPGETL